MRRIESSAPPARTTRLVLSACLAVGAVLRFTGLTTESFWLDEGWTLYVIDRASLSDVVVGATKDVHPPLYFVLAWGWVRIVGDSDAALRALSAVLSTAAIPATWALCRRLVAPRAALVATAIVALSPLVLRHAHEARQYSLVLLLATISTERFLAFAQGASKGALVGWALATTALAYTHVIGVTTVLAQDVLLLIGVPNAARRGRELLGPWIVGHVVVGLAVGPWVPYALDAASRFQGYPGSDSPRALWRAIVSVAGSAKGVATLFGTAGVGFVLRHRRRRRPPQGVGSAAVLASIPLFLPWISSALTSPSFASRLAIPAVPALSALLGAGLVHVLRPARRGLALALAIAVVATALGRLHPRVQREQWREAAALVAAEAKRGDVVLALGAPDRLLLRRYLPADGPSLLDASSGVPSASTGGGKLYVVPSIHARDLAPLRASLAARGWREEASTPLVMVRVLRFGP